MTCSTPAELIDLLQSIERRSREHAAGIPQQDDSKDYWEGVLCQVAGLKVVAPLKEISEILGFMPTITPVPGTKDWLLGVANVRGNLLPIVDLQHFLGSTSSHRTRRSRVLVINHNGALSSLLVESVQGMRHFASNAETDAPELQGAMRDYVDAGCIVDGEVWPIFRVSKLAESAGFQVAAA